MKFSTVMANTCLLPPEKVTAFKGKASFSEQAFICNCFWMCNLFFLKVQKQVASAKVYVGMEFSCANDTATNANRAHKYLEKIQNGFKQANMKWLELLQKNLGLAWSKRLQPPQTEQASKSDSEQESVKHQLGRQNGHQERSDHVSPGTHVSSLVQVRAPTSPNELPGPWFSSGVSPAFSRLTS